MSSKKNKPETRRKEPILLALRRHPAKIIPLTFRTGTVALFPIAFWLVGTFSPWAGNPYLHAAIGLIVPPVLLAIWLSFAAGWTREQLDLWMITTHRLIHVSQQRFEGRQTKSWNLDRMLEATAYRGGPTRSMFDYGQVFVRMPGEEFVMEDIPHPDEVQRLLMEQQNRYADLERKNEEHEDLIKFVSHEMKGYLAKNKAAFASIVEGDYGQVPQELKGMAGAALADTDKGVKTVMHLLDEGEAAGNQTIFDLREAVLAVTAGAEEAAKKKGLAFEVVIDQKPCTMKGDEILLRDEVVKNIVENALQYTPQGSIRIVCKREGSFLVFSVEDTGVGITDEDMPKLFTDGGRGAESRTINPQSTGYGLVAAKKTVEEHGGTIEAESKGRDLGAKFTVKLPVVTGYALR